MFFRYMGKLIMKSPLLIGWTTILYYSGNNFLYPIYMNYFGIDEQMSK